MIDWLRTGKSGNFYKKQKRLPKAAIVDLFRTIRQSSRSPTNNLFQHLKEQEGDAEWSALSFFYERDPFFLALPPGETKERICGFLVLVEYRDYAACFKSSLEIPTSFRAEYFHRVGDDRVEAAIASGDATFEQIRLANMATSKHVLRSKTLEADNLTSVVGPSGASRFVPRAYRVRRDEDHYSATPSSGRISLRSDRVGYADLVRWAMHVIDLLIQDNAPVSRFIRTFARAVNLDSIPSGVSPTYIAIDVPRLTEALFEERLMQLVRHDGDENVVLAQDEVEAVLAVLDRALPIRKVRKELRIIGPNDQAVGEIAIGKTRVSLRSFRIPEIEDLHIEPVDPIAGQEDESTSLKRYIDQNDLYTILFSDVSIAYLDGSLYRDDSIADGSQFLSYIRADPRLGGKASEKGTFAGDQEAFSADSVFHVIAEGVADADALLVCDDLGDEWADFIGINRHSQPKTVSFYHAKHGGLTLGASALHIVVSQAIKNLGRINLPPEDIEAKLQKWNAVYRGENVETRICRVVRGNVETLSQEIRDVLLSPDTIRRVFVVTTSLSRNQLAQTFEGLRQGDAPTPHFVQLYWLLMSYFSACNEIGAFPYLVCQP
jgi:hypothetical protein